MEMTYPLIYGSISGDNLQLPIFRFIQNISMKELTDEFSESSELSDQKKSVIEHCGKYFDICRVNRNLITHGFWGTGIQSSPDFKLWQTRDSKRKKHKSHSASLTLLSEVIKSMNEGLNLMTLAPVFLTDGEISPIWQAQYTNLSFSPPNLEEVFPLPEMMTNKNGNPQKQKPQRQS